MNQAAFLALIKAIRNMTITIKEAESLVYMDATEQQVKAYIRSGTYKSGREYGPDTSGIVER